MLKNWMIYQIHVIIDMHLLLSRAYPGRPNPSNCYERYLRHVDQEKHEYQRWIDYAWSILDKPTPGPGEVPRFNFIKSVLTDPLLVIKLISAHPDPAIRFRRSQLAIESYVRKIEPLFKRQLTDEFYNNVDWDMFTHSPHHPQESFLRWHRWRCYCLNRWHRHEDDSGVEHLRMIDDHEEGPPQWRDVDDVRPTKRI
jgi:hypothetical protein